MRLSHDKRRAIRRKIAEFSVSHTDAETAAKFGVCDKTVKDSRKEFGLQKSLDSLPQPSQFAILAKLLRGEQQIQVARSMGLTKQRVSAVYRGAKSAGIFDLFKRTNPKKGTRS